MTLNIAKKAVFNPEDIQQTYGQWTGEKRFEKCLSEDPESKKQRQNLVPKRSHQAQTNSQLEEEQRK